MAFLKRITFCAALAALPLALHSSDLAPSGLRVLDQPDAERDARVAWHREARFGCFVHFGVFSGPAGEFEGRPGGTYSEHLMRSLQIPRSVYLEKVARPFNPTGFDADAWVKLMHDAGMKYLVITAKHHDGFAMYPSKVSSYNLHDVTAFKRDIMAELSAACKKYGLKFGFYYSHAWDWENPNAIGNFWDYGAPGGESNWWEKRPDLIPKAAKYVEEKSIPQIRELIAMYHPDILWFDTSSKLPPVLTRRILEATRAAGPNVVLNSRIITGASAYGDYRSTGDRPAYFPEVFTHWEAIPTTNESYGYKPSDTSHKPPAHFIQLLSLAVGKGGNILMNIGPRGDGVIDPKDQSILRGIGAWMHDNSESIYGCDRTPLPVQPWGASTRKGNRLYLHVFHWPENGKLLVEGLRSTPSSARLLHGSDVEFKKLSAEDAELSLPDKAPDAVDSVIVLDFPSEIAANKALRVGAERPMVALHVMDGKLEGEGIRYGDGKTARDVIEEWTGPTSAVTWTVRVPQAGKFKVAAQYNTHTKDNAGTFIVASEQQELTGTVTPTPNVTAFTTLAVGELTLTAGEHVIAVRPKQIAGGNLMRLRELELTPIH